MNSENMVQLQLPDLSAAAGALEVLADNVRRCSNIPAFEGGAAFQRAVDATTRRLDIMDGRFDALEAKLDAKFDGMMEQIALLSRNLGAKIDRLDVKSTALDWNSKARSANSNILNPVLPVTPLRNPQTGREIPDGPETLTQLEELSSEFALGTFWRCKKWPESLVNLASLFLEQNEREGDQ
ncbi:hypothetical protein E4U41_006364 [Claviceps citrina]|nr:hypothetical protein E4U41_006364 [Claviceps citrina]